MVATPPHTLRLLVLLLCLGYAAPGLSQTTQDGSKSLLERIKERRQSRQAAREAPKSETATLSGPGSYTLSLQHAGLTRHYKVHVPASYSATTPTPMVLSFHGGGGNMDYQANDAYYGQISKSEQAGFIAVFPNGYSKRDSGKLATWNAGNCCAAARDENSDDVGFVRALVRQLSGQLNVDASRIFANGMSNGGMMAYRLACEMPDVFRAVASVAGTDNTRSCSPARPISILHIHARDDELELFNGGAGRKSDMVTNFVSVPDSVAKWVRLNACHPTPRRVLDTAGASCELYAPCQGGIEVKLCVTEKGGHSWPGGHKPRGDTPPSSALSATDTIWDFFGSR